MPTREELIKQCKYYKGEEKSPYNSNGDTDWFWDMERVYVKSNGECEGEEEIYRRLGGKSYPGHTEKFAPLLQDHRKLSISRG